MRSDLNCMTSKVMSLIYPLSNLVYHSKMNWLKMQTDDPKLGSSWNSIAMLKFRLLQVGFVRKLIFWNVFNKINGAWFGSRSSSSYRRKIVEQPVLFSGCLQFEWNEGSIWKSIIENEWYNNICAEKLHQNAHHSEFVVKYTVLSLFFPWKWQNQLNNSCLSFLWSP